jgi:hypothetical protein
MFKKLKDEAPGLAWTLGGTAMVLITLSGETLKWGLWITSIAAAVYIASIAFGDDKSAD